MMAEDKALLEKTRGLVIDEEDDWGVCEVCGSKFKRTKSDHKYCSGECTRIGISNRRKLRDEMHNKHINEGTFILLEDPIKIKEGGFRPGTIFNKPEIDAMIKQNSFAVGTVIYDTKTKNTLIYRG